MDLLHRYLEHEFQGQPNKATYRQCKHIWALCIIAGIDPVWCKDMPYGQAILLISKLEIIRTAKYELD